MSKYLDPFELLGLLVFLLLGIGSWIIQIAILVKYNFPTSETFKRVFGAGGAKWISLELIGMYSFLFSALTTAGAFLLWHDPIHRSSNNEPVYKNFTQQQLYLAFLSFYIITVLLMILWSYLYVSEITSEHTTEKNLVRRPRFLGAMILILFLHLIAISMAIFSYWIDHVTAAFYTIYAVGFIAYDYITVLAWYYSQDANYRHNSEESNKDYFYRMRV